MYSKDFMLTHQKALGTSATKMTKTNETYQRKATLFEIEIDDKAYQKASSPLAPRYLALQRYLYRRHG